MRKIKLNVEKCRLVLKYVQVDREGNTWYKDGRPLKQRKTKAGYWEVYPCVEGKQYFCRVHTLVALRWLGDPPEGKTEVSHKDETRTNNRVENLAWATHEENLNMPTYKQRQRNSLSFEQRSAMRAAQKKRVGQYDLQGNLIAGFDSAWAAARATGFAQSHINACCLGKPHCLTCGGYIWRFLDK